MYGHKTSPKLDFGLDRTCMSRVMPPYSAKYAVFEIVNTVEATFVEQSQPNFDKICMAIIPSLSLILDWSPPV